MPSPVIYLWKRAPFVRILFPFITGILIQWYCPLPLQTWAIVSVISFIGLVSFFRISFFRRYKYSWLSGLCIALLFIALGALLAAYRDIRNDRLWFDRYFTDSTTLVVTINEPPIEKSRSLKAEASVKYILKDSHITQVKGKIILYFKKDLPQRYQLGWGTQLILRKPLQEIKNSGNPGCFDYRRYALFQGVTHQAYAGPGDFELLKEKNTSLFQRIFYPTQEKVLGIIRQNIKGDKERGLAEALLIGYKNDLDKTLVQSYSNTGVVHVIAISGLHIGLIYWLLSLLLKPLQRGKYGRWLWLLLIIGGLWGFSLLAGGQPSVLRSAVMFSCIALGQSLSRHSSVYNTLALSAFLLLCYNPYWLWDAGFQLSYSAVLSILIFMKPVYNWFYIKNKWLDLVWQMNAVTLAAQVLTLPVSIYYFHQFPASFWLSNLVAVPLSSLIVLGEILLCATAFIAPVALIVGNILSWMIRQMNHFVEMVERLPGSVWSGMQIDLWQAVFLFGMIGGISCWLMEKLKKGLLVALACLLCFTCMRTLSFLRAAKQERIIVYNIPGHSAIDFVEGRNYVFTGDSSIATDDMLRRFHLEPSRVLHRVKSARKIQQLFTDSLYALFKSKRILLVHRAVAYDTAARKTEIDLVIISKNPKVTITRLLNTFCIKQVVVDGSVPQRKRLSWKKECDSLRIPCHDVSEKGAFVMSLN